MRNQLDSHDLVIELQRRHFCARQNRDDTLYFLTLGGTGSVLDRNDFAGLILLNPKRGLVFGASPSETLEFRSSVMRKLGEDWVRNKEVKCGNVDNRVPVIFGECGTEVFCPLINGAKLVVEGLIDRLDAIDGVYERQDVEAFLAKLQAISLTS